MIDYQIIKLKCAEDTELSIRALDKCLLHYHLDKAQNKLTLQFVLNSYWRQLVDLEPQLVDLLVAEFTAHQLFGQKHLIQEYLKDPEMLKLPEAEYQYLEWHAKHTWRFSFAVIQDNPEPGFFNMLDLLTNESYLLYSPGLQKICKTGVPRLCFNLISFNGLCWQTYGVVICSRAYTWDDIFFLSEWINPEIEDEEGIAQEVESNCFPFLLLVLGMNSPIVSSQGYEIIFCGATDYCQSINLDQMQFKFSISSKGCIVQMKPHEMSEFPHDTVAYFDPKKKEIIRNASTLEGYDFLTEALRESGIEVETGADYYVTPAMYTAAEKILDQKISLTSEHRRLFNKPLSKEDELTKRMNKFVQMILPNINSGEKPDIEGMAFAAGLDSDLGEELWEKLSNKYSK
jgi:hypothetical protein